jgi:hypothetical protein
MKPAEVIKFRINYTPNEKICVYRGFTLAVLYDERDEAKRCGAKWDPTKKVWWIPCGIVDNPETKMGGPATNRQHLNRLKMIVGSYGNVDQVHCERTNLVPDATYCLEHENGHRIEFKDFRSTMDVIRFDGVQPSPSTIEDVVAWKSPEAAKGFWVTFIEEGYNRNTKWEEENLLKNA